MNTEQSAKQLLVAFQELLWCRKNYNQEIARYILVLIQDVQDQGEDETEFGYSLDPIDVDKWALTEEINKILDLLFDKKIPFKTRLSVATHHLQEMLKENR